jgi:hypothetical protein
MGGFVAGCISMAIKKRASRRRPAFPEKFRRTPQRQASGAATQHLAIARSLTPIAYL